MKKLKIIPIMILLFVLGFLFFNLYSMKYEFIQKEEDRKEIKSALKGLKDNVKMYVFTKKNGCQYCDLAVTILREVSSLSEKIEYKKYDIKESSELAKRYNIPDAPAIVVIGKSDIGIRFLGIPAGYEFVSLIESLKLASNIENSISKVNREKIKKIKEKVNIDVFITPTCPYCPRAVVTAFNIASLNKNITARMIEAYEFQEMSQKNNVSGVPKIVVTNGRKKVEFVGALPEDSFVEKVVSVCN